MYTPEENKILDHIGAGFLMLLAQNSLMYGPKLTITAMSEVLVRACHTLRLPKERVIENITAMLTKLESLAKEPGNQINETDPNLN